MTAGEKPGGAPCRSIVGALAKHLGRKPKPPGRVHDYRKRYWGHDRVWTPAPGTEGRKGTAYGWGPLFGSRPVKPGLLSLAGDRIAKGDLLVFEGPNGGGSLYRVEEIRYSRDPDDMWHARLHYEPKPTADEVEYLRAMTAR